jgi:hypothetical protein
MDENGRILNLSYDATVPFARYVARSRITSLRRWTVCRLYRKASIGNFSREPFEMSFDIVTPLPSSGKQVGWLLFFFFFIFFSSIYYFSAEMYCIGDSEVIKMIYEFLLNFSDALGNFFIKVTFFLRAFFTCFDCFDMFAVVFFRLSVQSSEIVWTFVEYLWN